ncbi:MAG: hypothetical protein J7497_03550, partial [Chitinophagaceae bacterium]|nr:hypothetical protein [Chitinophagaceae bacterium]
MKREISRRQFIRTSALGTSGVIALGINTKSNFKKEADVIIDSHCHAWPYWPYTPEVPDPGSRGTAEQLINQMNLWGVDQATIVSAQIEHNPGNNKYVAEAVKKYPTRLHQYADIDSVWSKTYHTPGAALRLENAVNNFPIKGFTHYLS